MALIVEFLQFLMYLLYTSIAVLFSRCARPSTLHCRPLFWTKVSLVLVAV